MHRLVAAILAGFITLFTFIHTAEAGTCRISITLDHSGSMVTPRTDMSLKPNGDPQTRCFAAGTAVAELISAIGDANVFDVTKLPGAEVVAGNDVYDTTCPNTADRLVSIRVFTQSASGNSFDLVTVTSATGDGFEPWQDAFKDWQKSIYYDRVNHVPVDNCGGGTPLAEAACRSAQDFPPGLPLPGDLRQAYILTDGEENSSNLAGCRVPADPINMGAPGSGGWGDRVTAMYTSRGIEHHGTLFNPPDASPNVATRAGTLSRAALEPIEAQIVRPTAAAAVLTGLTTDKMFFTSLAVATGGSFTFVPDNKVIAPSVAYVDSDGDGVPDLRDFCPFGMCVDTDGDQIPDSMDACLVSQFEDGNGPFPNDGCSDFDSDGIRDGLDQCPTKDEDWYPPKPNDGCPRVVTAAAAPAMPWPMVGLLAFGMLGLGIISARRSKSLIEVA